MDTVTMRQVTRVFIVVSDERILIAEHSPAGKSDVNEHCWREASVQELRKETSLSPHSLTVSQDYKTAVA
ncbi:hypothetical protein BaRGS_00007514 [Batillaria attramentaria]|uniref:Uncharacterized protein n=1 Tax=Batillaria attramentaria TaxID=370345 RepID=A0ABD0LPH2_9CAEN